MIFKNLNTTHAEEITQLFTSVFTASESAEEGRLIGTLSAQLAASIDNEQTLCFGAFTDKPSNPELIACIFCTRLTYAEPVEVYMLAPVAVSTQNQGQGIGQALINFGLAALKQRGTSIVVTYGDPAFYGKVGFSALSEDYLQAPVKLSMPFGWLGQSLTAKEIPTLPGRPQCVAAFANPIYW